MKKLLLTNIAALFLATGTVHAQSSKLPNEIMGEWCFDKFVDDEDDVSHYWREEEAPSCDDVLILNRQELLSGTLSLQCHQQTANLINIEVADPGTYRIRANCEEHWKFSDGHPDEIEHFQKYFEIQIFEKQLLVADVSEG